MADDDNPLKYMRYAIGEIILIVIGIVIAVQINIFKNMQNVKQIVQKVLSKLKADPEKDTTDLHLLLTRKKSQYLASAMSLDDWKIQKKIQTE